MVWFFKTKRLTNVNDFCICISTNVTSGGIGKGIAKRLAQEGANVLVHYNTRKDGAISTCNDIRSSGGQCDGILCCDFRSPESIHEMMAKVDELWDGQLDVLVNNAGIVTKMAIEDDDDSLSVWHETMAVR